MQDLLFSFIMGQNLFNSSLFNERIKPKFFDQERCVYYKAFLNDFQVFPIDNHFLKLHLVMESKIQLKLMVHHKEK